MGHQVQQDGNWNIQPALLDWLKGTVLLSWSGCMQESTKAAGQLKILTKPLTSSRLQTPKKLLVSNPLRIFGHLMNQEQLSPQRIEAIVTKRGIAGNATATNSFHINSCHSARRHTDFLKMLLSTRTSDKQQNYQERETRELPMTKIQV